MLSRPSGHLLLVGSSGVGRRTAVTLISFLHRAQLVSPLMTRDYGEKEFKNECLKDLLKAAGVDNKKMVLYLEDHHLVKPAFLGTRISCHLLHSCSKCLFLFLSSVSFLRVHCESTVYFLLTILHAYRRVHQQFVEFR